LAAATGYTLNMPSGQTVAFNGQLHNGPYTRSNLGRGNGLQSGWHFLGNPYPSPISWTRAFAGEAGNANTGAQGLDNAVYVYQSSGQYGGGYASFVNGISVNGGTDEIALGRGFFVRTSAPGTAGRLALTNAARLTTYANPNLQRGTADTRPLVRLALAGAAGPTDEAVVYLENGATTGFDSAFDAYKITAGSRSLAFEVGGELLAVNALPLLGTAPAVLPLQVLVSQTGAYTIEARELLNLPQGTVAQLRDTQTGSLIALHPQTRYSFTATSTSLTGRFFLLLNPAQALASTPGSVLADVTLYPNPAHDRLWISRTSATAGQVLHLTLLNSLGQVVRQQTVSAASGNPAISLAGLARGIYTVQVRSAAGTVARRLAIE
jgi:hypothetical protein